MRPNTPHMVYTVFDSICHGWHFYTTSTLRDSLYGIVHCFMAQEVVTNTEHPKSIHLLLRLIHYFHQELVGGDLNIDLLQNPDSEGMVYSFLYRTHSQITP